MTLRGPAHPDNFRVKVGRYGDRWYIDNLPADDLADGPMSDPVPSVSTVKNAFPKFLTDWAAGEAAAFAVDNYEAWSKLDRAAAVDLISKAHTRTRDAAALRGTAVHEFIEGQSTGALVDIDSVPAEYEPVLKQMVDDLQPQFLVSEAVAIKRGLEGYGGTMDGIAELFGFGTMGLDWKTRKAGKGGSAYPDEFAQVDAYLSADYFIVGDDNGGAKRIAVPEVDGIAVVTIDPDGYHVCAPDDAGKVHDLWVQLRRFWSVQTLNPPRSRRLAAKFEGGGENATTERGTASTAQQDVVGTVDDPTTATALDILHEARTAWLINRTRYVVGELSPKHVGEVWPTDLNDARPAHIEAGTAVWTPEDIDLISQCLHALEKKHEIGFTAEDPKVTDERRRSTEAKLLAERQRMADIDRFQMVKSQPKQSTEVAPVAAVDVLLGVIHDMAHGDDDARARIGRVQLWQKQGSDRGVPWKIGQYANDTVPLRLYAVAAAAVGCGDLIDIDAADPDAAVRDLLGVVLEDHDLAQQPSHPVGALFGLLTTEQALRLAEMAETATNKKETQA